MRKKEQIKKGEPSWTSNGVVMGWRIDENQKVPAIEQSRITVVKFPILFYQHFNYSPEAMALRPQSIIDLGWDNLSFDLPMPTKVVGEYSLLSGAVKRVKDVLDFKQITITKNWPSTITCFNAGCGNDYSSKYDYCVLFFNHAAYEFYHFFFILGSDTDCPFENVPNPTMNTLNQLLKWTESFERKRQKLYIKHGFTWGPAETSYATLEKNNLWQLP